MDADHTSYLSRPWLKSYKLGPYKLEHSLAPYPHVPVFTALDQAAENYPGQTAILFLGRSYNYAQLRDMVNRLASALIGLGIGRGDRVCLFLPNCIEFIICDWAILKAGGAVVPTSILRTDEGLLHEVGSSGSKIVVCQEQDLERVLGVRDTSEVEHILVIPQGGFNFSRTSRPLPKGVQDFGRLLDGSSSTSPQVELDPDQDLCELAFTGGATGVPKGVMVTHFNRYSCILQGFPWLLKPVLRGLAGKASVLLPVPLFHAYGHYALQTAAYLGLRVILLPDPRDTDLIVKHIQEYRPFLIAAVPTQLMRIAQANLSRLNVLLLSGSAPLPSEIAATIKEKTGMPVSEGYGLTETSPLTHFNVSAFSRITGFMAREKPGIGIPSPDTDCMLVDLETGNEAPFGEPGEILVRGPQIMKGYWPEPGSGLTEDGWLRTGDIGVMDEDGYFQVVDRTKDMVNISGLKVYTTNVDQVLFRHPGVLLAAAFGVPDPEIPGSERVMAVIQLKEEFKGRLTVEELLQFCRQHLPVYAVPKYIEFQDDVPLTVSEKVFKRVLREAAINRMRARGEIP